MTARPPQRKENKQKPRSLAAVVRKRSKTLEEFPGRPGDAVENRRFPSRSAYAGETAKTFRRQPPDARHGRDALRLRPRPGEVRSEYSANIRLARPRDARCGLRGQRRRFYPLNNPQQAVQPDRRAAPAVPPSIHVK